MKYLRMFNSRVMNEATEIDDNGSEASFDIANNSDFIEPTYKDTLTELGLDASKYGLDENQDESSSEESQGSEEVEEAGQATDEKSYLDRVNSLGAIHGETPVKVESEEQLKELIQKGFDYTQKTQSLSEERKAWADEKSSAEKELNSAIEEFNNAQKAYGQQLQELQQWTFTINQLKENAPDVFEEVQRAYEGTTRQFSNPIINQQLETVNKRLSEAEAKLAERENKLIVDSFESEKSSLSATEQSMKELGVTIDWQAVKKEWAATGLPLKNVVGSLYFDSIAKAQASRSKVETTKAKVAARPQGVSGVSRPGNKVPQIDRKLSLYEQAQQMYKHIK